MKILTSFMMMLLLCASVALAMEDMGDDMAEDMAEDTVNLAPSEQVMRPTARSRVGVMVTNFGTPLNLPSASPVNPSEKVAPLYFMQSGARSMPSLEKYPHMYYITAERMDYLGLPAVFETKRSSVKPMKVHAQPHTYRVAYPSSEQTTRWQTMSQSTHWTYEMPQAPYYVVPDEYYAGKNPTPYTYSYRDYTDAIGGMA